MFSFHYIDYKAAPFAAKKNMVFAFDNYDYTSAHIGSHLVTRTAIGRHRYRTEPSALIGG